MLKVTTKQLYRMRDAINHANPRGVLGTRGMGIIHDGQHVASVEADVYFADTLGVPGPRIACARDRFGVERVLVLYAWRVEE